MKTCTLKLALKVLLCCFIIILIFGCASPTRKNITMYDLNPYRAKFTPTSDKIQLKVALLIPTDTGPPILGGVAAGNPVLASNLILDDDCNRVVQAAFSEVLKQYKSERISNPNFDAILSYKVIKSETLVTGMFSWDDLVLSLSIEWRLSDPKEELIWVDTVDAQAMSPVGNLFTHRDNFIKRTEALADNLAQKSYLLLSTTQVIKDYAKSVNKISALNNTSENSN